MFATRTDELVDALQIVADYFPDALIELAKVCRAGNRQHNGDSEILFWDRSKSATHFTKGVRHWTRRGEVDSDGTLHTAKAGWRALADLQLEREQAGAPIAPAALRAPLPYGELLPHSRAREIERDILRQKAEADDDNPGYDPIAPAGAQSGIPVESLGRRYPLSEDAE